MLWFLLEDCRIAYGELSADSAADCLISIVLVLLDTGISLVNPEEAGKAKQLLFVVTFEDL